MTKENKDKLKNQRVFQHTSGRYILLTKAGKAVSFRVDEGDRIHVLEELEGVDFRATGTQLKKEGWRCIGPGIEFDALLKEESLK
ncbi:MAG: hypothetical protein U9Q38_09350 [Thermodesulfobacteriota bacterium]|nr:hypothetical protein [Thermodesulfobacteriota bacterium]